MRVRRTTLMVANPLAQNAYLARLWERNNHGKRTRSFFHPR